MKKIPLTRGLFATVDDEDFEELSKFKWHAIQGTCTFYAARRVPRDLKTNSTIVYMHRAIVKAPRDLQVDHWDSNGLNNVRKNLRIATHAQNQRNGRRPKNNTTGFMGVHKNRSKFRAQIWVDGVKKHLGMFSSAAEAHGAYCRAAIELHGDFARFE